MTDTCTCGHDESLHESPRATYAYAVPCRHIGCDCTEFDPAPAGVSAAPTSRDRPIGPAGAHQTSSSTTEMEPIMSTPAAQASVTISWPVPDDLKRRVTTAVWDATGHNINRATACDAWKAAIGVLIEAAGESVEASGGAKDGAQ